VTDDDRLAPHDRAIARALDAENDEVGVDEQLVADYQEVLAHLPLDEAAPRPELEDVVVAAALARRPAAAVAIDRRTTARRSRMRTVVLVASAVAAVVVASILVTSRSTSTTSTTGRIATAASQTDVDALLHQPGSRSASFTPSIGHVVLATNGHGDVYGLLNNNPVVIVLETDRGSVGLPLATPQNGVIGFSVTHPELVRAVRLTTGGGVPLGRAPLS